MRDAHHILHERQEWSLRPDGTARADTTKS